MSTAAAYARPIPSREPVTRAARLPATPAAERPHLTEDDLCSWLGKAFPGDTIEYHRGFLAVDQTAALSKLSDVERRRLTAVARRARIFAEEGRADLVQRRYGDSDYGYLAIKATTPRGRRR